MIAHDEKPRRLLEIVTRILSFRKMPVIESSQKKEEPKEKEKPKEKTKPKPKPKTKNQKPKTKNQKQIILLPLFLVVKANFRDKRTTKTIYAKCLTVCVSGLAKHKTDIANGRY